MVDYESCKYFVSEDVTGWHNDVYDHPSYKNYCTRTGEKVELILPSSQCERCMKAGKNEAENKQN